MEDNVFKGSRFISFSNFVEAMREVNRHQQAAEQVHNYLEGFVDCFDRLVKVIEKDYAEPK